MADVSLSDLGSADNPLPGLDASDYAGFGSGGNISGSFGDPGSSSLWSGAGALGLGALGLGAILGKGESPLPAQFQQLQGNVPGLMSTGQGLVTQGQGLVGQGQQALGMAQRGELTPEQQAQVGQYSTGLTNQARQMYYNMGVNPDNNTSFLSTTADIDAKVNAMAQQQIQSTIQLGLGEISGGSSLIGQGQGFENAANQALIAAGNAQMQQDKNYSDSLTNVFSGIAKMAGSFFKL
jgi:hypothetical protein